MSRWDTEARPHWIAVLDEQCEATSQGRVSARLGFSSAMIGQIRRGIYPGRYDRAEQAVRGHFMAGVITCPALGKIRANECVDHQKRAQKFTGSNPLRITMFRACRRCARFTDGETS